MYRFLRLFLVLTAMRNFLWAYEDFYRRPTPPIRDQQYFSQNYQRRGRYNEDQFGNAPVATSGYERLSNGNPTARNYVDSTPSNMDYYYNASETHGQGVINKRKSEGFEQDSKMVYPSEEDTSSTDNQIKSRNCSFGLCDEVDDYPVEKVHNILKRYELKNYFSIEKEVNIINRFGEDTENLCATITHTRFPKTAKNMQDKEQVIVNVDQYKQGVVFETCKNEGPCSYAENFPNNITPKCVQKYTVRKLMVVGKESDDTVFDDFKIPSCCVCMVKK